MGNGNSAVRRPSTRAPLITTGLLLIGAGTLFFWLHATDRLASTGETPRIVAELAPTEAPAPGSMDTAEAGGPTAADGSAAHLSAGENEAAPEDDAASGVDAVPDEEAAASVPEAAGPAEPAAAVELPSVAAPAPLDGTAEPGEPTAEFPPAPTEEQTTDHAGENVAPDQASAPAPAEADAAATTPEPPGDGGSSGGEAPAATPQLAAAWQRLARPFPADETRPRIAVVLAGLGLSEAATTAAIQQLPAEVTLSFSPYSNRLDTYIAMARAAGHEVLLDLPMEPVSFPRDDPGPQALLTSLSQDNNAQRLAWTLGRAEGYLGVATYMGSRFTTSAEHLRPVLAELKRRGLLLLDSRAAPDSLAAALAAEAGVPHAINDRFVDNEASRVAIDGRLQQIERIARTSGVAVAMGYAYPVTIERLSAWSRSLSGKGLILAPISAVVGRQEIR